MEYGFGHLALTDTNLCGALDFARQANGLGLKPITGGELTLTYGSRLALLAKTREGYGNLSRLFTLANAADRKDPKLDPRLLAEHAGGLVLLTGGRNGPLSTLLEGNKAVEAKQLLYDYLDWFGSDSVYVELQQNFLQGDVQRNRDLAALADRAGAPVVATNDVHYHIPVRYRLQHALVAASHNTTIDQALRHIQPNHHLCMKSPGEMEELFNHCPEAIANTRRIAGMCEFDLSADLGYTLPDADVPEGYTPDSYLQQLSYEAATRRYGSVTPKVAERLREEFRLIELHNLSGFLLLYREIVQIAQQIMEERGLSHPEIPLEERPPGRGRGSSVALLVGYLIGISHVDPLQWDLTLERFISDDTSLLPDIDLDFPRQLRDELIQRVAPALWARLRRAGRGSLHLPAQRRDPGPGQGTGPASGRAVPAVRTATVAGCWVAGHRDGGAARVPGAAGRARLAGPDRAGPAADRRAQGAGSARGRHDTEQLAHTRDGACPRRGHGGAIHHGLEQGQRGRCRVRQDRPALAAGAGPAGGGAGYD